MLTSRDKILIENLWKCKDILPEDW